MSALTLSDNGANADRLRALHQLSENMIELLEKQLKSLVGAGFSIHEELLEGLTLLADSLKRVMRDVVDQDQERRRLYALAEVGKVINSSLDRTTVLNEVMDTIISLTGAERGFLMLFNDLGRLNIHIARNMERETLDKDEFRISRTIVSRVATSGIPILTTDAMEDPRFVGQRSVAIYNLRSILCVPLKVKGDVTGVIYADNRVRTGLFTKLDLRILAAFANQAAVAIENARLFDDLQQSNAELSRSYEITLEGWARALELRDRETEGHTRRVAELTVHLARRMGVEEDDLVHIRRGALLHDIGKMGIPDRILLKPGPLTGEEREVMQRHPVYAYEMLSPIEKLQPALDIPYRHHEKWDGSGYPGGLAGEEIPLAARIFAVVDVWDALSSDRPYRKAWPKERTRSYILEQAGKHFDPRVVKVFLRLGVN